MDLSDLKKLGLDVAYPFKEQYENYIGGQWVAPAGGEYFDNLSPITGQPFCRVPR
ncbi:aldehyde dehydrogenase, partial [Bordetella pertussis]